jgi:hypothetical protein
MVFLHLCVPLNFCSMKLVMVVLAYSVLLTIICSLKSFIASSTFTISCWINPVRCLFISDISISAVKIPFMLSSQRHRNHVLPTNTNLLIFGLTQLGPEPKIYHTRGEHANHYAVRSLPVACPWLVVLSGYSGFFHD